jgi:predicted amidophosphoribosyltransferase
MAFKYACPDRFVLHGFLPGLILYRYEGEMRDLILAAKVANRYPALIKLCKLVLGDPRIPGLLQWAEGLAVVPPSLWGRLRGRYDVVSYLGIKMAEKYGKPLVRFEVPLLWRRRKRALEKSRDVQSPSMERPRGLICQEGLTRLVLFDDVATTGFTLMNFLPFLEGKECIPLVVAGANKVVEIPPGSSIKL